MVKINRMVSPSQELRNITIFFFFCHISLSYFSVSVIKCSDEGNLKEKGFGLLYSSWRIQSAMVE